MKGTPRGDQGLADFSRHASGEGLLVIVVRWSHTLITEPSDKSKNTGRIREVFFWRSCDGHQELASALARLLMGGVL
jgi:hypothetical protein